jgi:hypothetical protein
MRTQLVNQFEDIVMMIGRTLLLWLLLLRFASSQECIGTGCRCLIFPPEIECSVNGNPESIPIMLKMTTEEIRLSDDTKIELLASLDLTEWTALKTINFGNTQTETCNWIKHNIRQSGIRIISSCSEVTSTGYDADIGNDFVNRDMSTASKTTADTSSPIDGFKEITDDYSSNAQMPELLSTKETVMSTEEPAVSNQNHEVSNLFQRFTSRNENALSTEEPTVFTNKQLDVTSHSYEEASSFLQTSTSHGNDPDVTSNYENPAYVTSDDALMNFVNASETVTLGQNSSA